MARGSWRPGPSPIPSCAATPWSSERRRPARGPTAIITEILHEAGLPAGVLNFLTSTPEDSDRVVEAIIAHPAVRRVNFTGSTGVGRIIAEKAARHLKPALLELGGKAPFVVLDDADIDGAVNAAVFGSFLYQGQICMSTERFVVDETVADEFVSKFVARAQSAPGWRPARGRRLRRRADGASRVRPPHQRPHRGRRVEGRGGRRGRTGRRRRDGGDNRRQGPPGHGHL